MKREEFVDVSEVKQEGVYDVSDTAFLSEWWPSVKVYMANGRLRMIHPEKDIEITLSGIKGWYFRPARQELERSV